MHLERDAYMSLSLYIYICMYNDKQTDTQANMDDEGLSIITIIIIIVYYYLVLLLSLFINI